MPLLRTCCMRALERDGYLATWPLLSLIMRIVCSRARVRVACLLFLFIILRNSWPVVVGAEQRKAAQRSAALIITNNKRVRKIKQKVVRLVCCDCAAAFVCASWNLASAK